MSPSYLHEKLIEACKSQNIDDVKNHLDAGADPNFNLKMPTNALDSAIQIDNHQIIKLLLKHGAIVKEFVLQKAIQKDKNYLELLIPDFINCQDKSILMGTLLAAINIGDLELTKKAIDQGAKVESLFLHSIRDIANIKILELLIENGLNIHSEKNLIISEWLGSSEIGFMKGSKSEKYDLLNFVSNYYVNKPNSIEKFSSLYPPDKSRLFRIGLDNNNFNMMKFALLIGTNKNEALNSSLYRYYAKNQTNSTTHSTMFKNNHGADVDYEIIEYILNSNIQFNKTTISNAVRFEYTDVLNALNDTNDLEYGYETAYKYQDDNLCEYFVNRGVSVNAQNLAKMKISALKGDIKQLQNCLNDGADLKSLDTNIIEEIINENQVKSIKYLYDLGELFDKPINNYLDKAMSYHKAYETITYLVEQGFDITSIKKIPPTYKKKYPTLSDMWEKRFSDIFEYTIYLATKVHPNLEGKDKDEMLKTIAELSTLPYVVKRSQERSNER